MEEKSLKRDTGESAYSRTDLGSTLNPWYLLNVPTVYLPRLPMAGRIAPFS